MADDDNISYIRNTKESKSNEAIEIRKGPRRRGFVVRLLEDFTTNSTLHGLKYVGEPSRSIFERLFWLSVFVLSVVTCAILIINLWKNWMQNPVIVSFGERMVPVWQAPFPAVTICPKTKIPVTKYNYNEQVKKYTGEDGSQLTDIEKEKIEDLTFLCEFHEDNYASRKYGNKTIVDNILSVSLSESEMFSECSWRDDACNFKRVLTNNGVCYSFNALSSEEILRVENLQKEYIYSEETEMSNGWTLEHGYSADAPIAGAYPRRGRNFGATADLTVELLDSDANLNTLCDGPLRGYEVLLHNPAETPRFNRHFFEVHSGNEMKVGVNFNLVSSSESLRNYDPISRQCYFPTERRLTYFKVYTQRNCGLECIANFTHERCGCVPYYMPFKSAHICAGGSYECLKRAQEALAGKLMRDNTQDIPLPEESINPNDTRAVLNGIARRCRCLPTCTTVTYDSDRSSTKADFSAFEKSLKAHYNIVNETIDIFKTTKVTTIKFFFKESEFISVRRSELYGPTNFLANCGGLLGLFMGFSVLSLVEIFYHLTFRLWSLIRSTRSSAAGMDKQTDGADLHVT